MDQVRLTATVAVGDRVSVDGYESHGVVAYVGAHKVKSFAGPTLPSMSASLRLPHTVGGVRDRASYFVVGRVSRFARG
eukprot:m.162261 g.162261  ORF g.162261 m.162261 type:complete len:78 (-) comp23866_c0_seq3:168-401(-)